MTKETYRAIYSKEITITVDNPKAKSHNVNIDFLSFFTFALNEQEAIGKMIQSDFSYRHLPIYKIYTHE